MFFMFSLATTCPAQLSDSSSLNCLLQEPCLERKVHEDDLLSITEVPSGLDANEWHALHSE